MYPFIEFGELRIPSFWLMAFTGFVAAFFVARADLRQRGYGDDVAYDAIFWAYVGGWVGARFFMIPGNWSLFVQDPVAFLLSGSGWVWYGGVAGGAVAVLLMARRRGMPAAVMADVAAPALAVGQLCGRIGCELSGDGDYGVPTTLPWATSYPHGVVPTTERVHPAPAYEAIATIVILAYLWRCRRQDPPAGALFGRYLILSAGVRFLVEFVRRNPAWLLGLTTAQWVAIGLGALGVWLVRRGSGQVGSPATT